MCLATGPFPAAGWPSCAPHSPPAYIWAVAWASAVSATLRRYDGGRTFCAYWPATLPGLNASRTGCRPWGQRSPADVEGRPAVAVGHGAAQTPPGRMTSGGWRRCGGGGTCCGGPGRRRRRRLRGSARYPTTSSGLLVLSPLLQRTPRRCRLRTRSWRQLNRKSWPTHMRKHRSRLASDDACGWVRLRKKQRGAEKDSWAEQPLW